MQILQYTSHFFGTRIMVTAAHRTAPHRTQLTAGYFLVATQIKKLDGHTYSKVS